MFIPLLIGISAAQWAGCASTTKHAVQRETDYVNVDVKKAKTTWLEALHSGDAKRVWQLMGRTPRAQFDNDINLFAGYLKKYGPQLMLQNMEPTGTAKLVIRMTPSGVHVVKEKSQWFIVQPPLKKAAGPKTK